MSVRLGLTLTLLALCTLAAAAQRHAPWRFGVLGGTGLNVAGVGYALWGPNGGTNPGREAGQFIADVGLDGTGIAHYGGLFAEYASLSWYGLQARLVYDDRTLEATDEESYAIGGRALRDVFMMRTRYLDIDPRVRIAPVPDGSLFFTLGAGAGIALSTEIDYTADDGSTASYAMPQASALAWSLNFGAQYDLLLNDPYDDVHWRLSPFIDASWMFGQRGSDPPPLTAATSTALTTFTARAGVMFSRGVTSDAVRPDLDDDGFFITATQPPYPSGTKVRTRDVLPMIPSVFIAPSDTVLPSRYRIKKFRPQDSASSYYDVVSVAAQLLVSDPSLTITLVGSDPLGDQGEALARMVQRPLARLVGADSVRIMVKGQRNPTIVSGSALTPSADRTKADAENRRVDIVLSDPSKWPSIVIDRERLAMIENPLVVQIVTEDVLEPWTVTITPEGTRRARTFGPFLGTQAVIPDAMLARGSAQRCTVEVNANTVEGISRNDQRWLTFLDDEPDMLRAERYVLLWTYGDDDPVKRHAAALQQRIAPRIDRGARVYVHGHTDDIGVDDVNRKLSYQHANGMARILRAAVDARKVDDVEVHAVGHGEDASDAIMNNQSPEGRQYNRVVIIDIVHPND